MFYASFLVDLYTTDTVCFTLQQKLLFWVICTQSKLLDPRSAAAKLDPRPVAAKLDPRAAATSLDLRDAAAT